MSVIEALQAAEIKKDWPEMHPGDQIRVSHKIIEGAKERVQNYEGVVVRFQGKGISRSIVVRRVVSQIGVEKAFPLSSPRVTQIKVIKQGKVRRARLYYLRERVGRKATRIADKKAQMTVAAVPSEAVS